METEVEVELETELEMGVKRLLCRGVEDFLVVVCMAD